MAIVLKEKIYNAIYFLDESTGIYTITMCGKGGPIISADSLEKAKAAFEEALDVAVAVDNLLFFKRFKASTPSIRKNLTTKVQYLQVA